MRIDYKCNRKGVAMATGITGTWMDFATLFPEIHNNMRVLNRINRINR